jgi:hypothetical protein
MRRLAGAITVFLLLVWACSDTSLFLGEPDEPAGVVVRTVPSGAMLEPGGLIPIQIQRGPTPGDEETPDSLLLEIVDLEGTVLAEEQIDSVDQATELPSALVPDLAVGVYQIRTTYYDGEEIAAEGVVTFFIVDATYGIMRITSYPPALYPESAGILRASIDAVVNSDPYLAWYLNGELQQAGYQSEGGAQLQVESPEQEGIYPVRVDLYPVWDQRLDLAEVPAPIVYTTELYVSESPTPARTDLTAESHYLFLYHFRGNLRDSGVRPEWFPESSFEAEMSGTASLGLDDDIFGYTIDDGSRLSVPGGLFPMKDGELTPFSIALRFQPNALSVINDLITVSADSGRLLSVVADQDGRIGAALGTGEYLWSMVPLISAGEVATIIISIVPVTDGVEMTYFAEGQIVLSEFYPLGDLGSLIAEVMLASDGWGVVDGQTILGGSDGFAAIIDELGVYFRDDDDQPSAHPSVFESAMTARYGDRLLYAEGFEAPELPPEISADEGVEVFDGVLLIHEGASARLPDFAFSDEDLIVQATLRASEPGVARFRRIDTEDEIATFPVGDGETDEFEQVILRFTHDGTELIVSYRGDSRTLQLADADGFVGLQLELAASDSEAATLSVRDVLAYTDRPRIPAMLFQPESRSID